jgi:hypothetical protein
VIRNPNVAHAALGERLDQSHFVADASSSAPNREVSVARLRCCCCGSAETLTAWGSSSR